MTARVYFFTETVKRRYLVMLTFLLFLFCLRVSGQLLVAFYDVPFLPPMDEWFSGAIPYPELFACQIVIILLYGKVCVDFARGEGFFVTPNRKLGYFLVHFGAIYLSVMILRYAIRMGLYPNERWTGGSIPIFFHWVLALFLLVLATYHIQQSKRANESFAEAGGAMDARTFKFRRRHNFRSITSWMFRAFVLIGIIGWVVWQVLPSALAYKYGLRSPIYAVREQHGVTMIMSDGTKLVADIYHPQHTRTTPTILVRIPLTKSLNNSIYANLMARIWAERGYTVVIQGTRGRFGSGGTFYPLRYEHQDGMGTLKWLAKQPWFNGQIATWGGSAFGYTQWTIADQENPAFSAMDIYESSTDFRKMFYPGGAFSLSSALSWAITSRGREDLPNWPSTAAIASAAGCGPLLDADKRAVNTEIPFFKDWANHNTDDSYWQKLSAANALEHSKSPALLMAGWYDPFLQAQVDDFEKLQHSANPEVAKQSRLIIGPWTHAGEVIFPGGRKSQLFRPVSFVMSLQWFDQILKLHPKTKGPSQPPVEIFVMGKNEWRNEQEWPLARTKYTRFFLQSSGRANGNARASNDGRLALSEQSHDQLDDAYTYDPHNPVPTAGGAMIGQGAGIASQNEIERRADVLIYTTPKLKEDLEVTGPVTAVLYVSTSAPQTDFTAKLVDVQADGSAFNVCDGILRMSYQTIAQKNSSTSDSSSIHIIKIDLWPTSMVFAKGHRIRLEVSSSNFPRFDRNPNTEGFIPLEIRLASANQRLHHSKRYPSQLILPIIAPNAALNNLSTNVQEYFE